jgi:hypothetical protein
MPTETRLYLDPEQRTGLQILYAKLFGSVTDPHSTGTISAQEVGNGYYDFAGLDTLLRYTVQEESTPGTRAASDLIISTLLPSLTSALEAVEPGSGASAAQVVAAIKADPDLGTAGLVADAEVARSQATSAAEQASAIRLLVEADQVVVLDGGDYKVRTTQRGTATQLIPDKILKQPGATDLTNPAEQQYGGAAQEPV